MKYFISFTWRHRGEAHFGNGFAELPGHVKREEDVKLIQDQLDGLIVEGIKVEDPLILHYQQLVIRRPKRDRDAL